MTETDEKTEDVVAANTILTAINLILGENGQKTVSIQQAVNEFTPGPKSLRTWFAYLIEEATLNDSQHLEHIPLIQNALTFKPIIFEKGCKRALEIMALKPEETKFRTERENHHVARYSARRRRKHTT